MQHIPTLEQPGDFIYLDKDSMDITSEQMVQVVQHQIDNIDAGYLYSGAIQTSTAKELINCDYIAHAKAAKTLVVFIDEYMNNQLNIISFGYHVPLVDMYKFTGMTGGKERLIKQLTIEK